MCGRFTLTRPADELVETFDVPDLAFDYVPSFNVAPGQAAAVLAEDLAGRRIGALTWGLVPSGFEKPGRGLINARAETVTRKPSFRDSFARRRCLIPADGFYEWKTEGAGKTPYWFHRGDRGLFTMAAIWDHWSASDGADLYTFAILTTAAGDDVRQVHDREPLVIAAGARDAWLARDTPLDDVVELLSMRGSWDCHEVDRRVGSPAQNDSGLIEAV